MVTTATRSLLPSVVTSARAAHRRDDRRRPLGAGRARSRPNARVAGTLARARRPPSRRSSASRAASTRSGLGEPHRDDEAAARRRRSRPGTRRAPTAPRGPGPVARSRTTTWPPYGRGDHCVARRARTARVEDRRADRGLPAARPRCGSSSVTVPKWSTTTTSPPSAPGVEARLERRRDGRRHRSAPSATSRPTTRAA